MSVYYRDERVTLYHGDALAVLRELPSASVDAVITDPPYSSGGMMRGDRANTNVKAKYSGGYGVQPTHEDFTGDSRDQRAYAYWTALWLSEALRVARPGSLCLMFTDWRQLPATTDAIQSGGWIWRGIVPWAKPSSRPMPGGFSASCEYVVWGSAGAIERDYENGIYAPGFFRANSPRDREHLTQKPLDVMRELVKIAPEGSRILDPFMGSGTTGAAAVMEGRRFIGVEMVEHYAEVSLRRILTAAGQRVGSGTQAALDFADEPA